MDDGERTEQSRVKVRLVIPSWAAVLLDGRRSEGMVMDKVLGDGATVGRLLSELASQYANFRKVVFDPETGAISDQVLVALNDVVLRCPHVEEVKLRDGDSVMLLMAYAGG